MEELVKFLTKIDPDAYQDMVFSNRIIPISSEIDDDLEEYVITHIAVLNAINPKREIKILIDTNGGQVRSALKIYDAILFSKAPVDGYVQSRCHSSGILILSACRNRIALPASDFLFHAGAGGVSVKFNHGYNVSPEEQVNIALEEHRHTEGMFLDTLASRLKITTSQIIELEKTGERTEYPISAKKALEIGLITKIAKTKKDWIW